MDENKWESEMKRVNVGMRSEEIVNSEMSLVFFV